MRLFQSSEGAEGTHLYIHVVLSGAEINGYYRDLSDDESLELFAVEDCRLSVERVLQIINSATRRGIFDAQCWEKFKILTNAQMQEMYIEATKARRKKGTKVTIRQELLLIDLTEFKSESGGDNIIIDGIVPENNSEVPEIKEDVPETNPQKKGKEKKENDSTGMNTPVIYSDFYDNQISINAGKPMIDKYAEFVKFIFGEGGTKKFSNVLSLRDQISYDNYVSLKETEANQKQAGSPRTLKTVIESMENRKGLAKDYLCAYLTANNWLKYDKK